MGRAINTIYLFIFFRHFSRPQMKNVFCFSASVCLCLPLLFAIKTYTLEKKDTRAAATLRLAVATL